MEHADGGVETMVWGCSGWGASRFVIEAALARVWGREAPLSVLVATLVLSNFALPFDGQCRVKPDAAVHDPCNPDFSSLHYFITVFDDLFHMHFIQHKLNVFEQALSYLHTTISISNIPHTFPFVIPNRAV